MANIIRNTTALVHDSEGRGYIAEQAIAGRAIERMEARGQAELCESDVLPADMSPSREAFEALGFAFGDPVDGDPLFVNVTLPAGWSKERTGHSMWSNVCDEKGRVRVEVFYKAAFYDRRADMRLAHRYEVAVDVRSEDPNVKSTWKVVDRATGGVLLSGATHDDAYAWLGANRPDHRDALASWRGA